MASKLSEWSKSVKLRDCKCMDCGSTEDLHAHHIKPKSGHPELTLDINNGKTLCYRCHKKEHETNRALRIRSDNPRKKTMASKLKELQVMVYDFREYVAELKKANALLRKKINLLKADTRDVVHKGWT